MTRYIQVGATQWCPLAPDHKAHGTGQMTADPQGRVYYIDLNADLVWEIRRDGEVLTTRATLRGAVQRVAGGVTP
jgi:hypothetical protein